MPSCTQKRFQALNKDTKYNGNKIPNGTTIKAAEGKSRLLTERKSKQTHIPYTQERERENEKSTEIKKKRDIQTDKKNQKELHFPAGILPRPC